MFAVATSNQMEALMTYLKDMRLRIASVIAAVAITAAGASQLMIWQLG
jgi:hypothetical protein